MTTLLPTAQEVVQTLKQLEREDMNQTQGISNDTTDLYNYLDKIQEQVPLLYESFWFAYSQKLETGTHDWPVYTLAEVIIRTGTPRATRLGGMLLIDARELISRDFVAEWMGEVGDPDGIPYLEVAATDKRNSFEVRSRACYALGCTKDVRAIPILKAILLDESTPDNEDDQYSKEIIDDYALRGLAKLNVETAWEIVALFLEPQYSFFTRRTALKEIGRKYLNEKTVPLLQNITEEDNQELFELAQEYLNNGVQR